MSSSTTTQRPALGPLASPAPAAVAAATAPPAAPRRIRSDALFEGPAVEIEIEHQQQVYRLRRTSLGKLILTK
jgi:hemin uptake protein HemP